MKAQNRDDMLPLDLSVWDEDCMKQFIRENSTLFYAFANRYVSDAGLVDDFLQEAYLKLWSRRKEIGKVRSVRNYFYSILRNTIIDKWTYFSPEGEERNLDDYLEVSSNDSFVQHIIEAESASLIAEAIRQLPPQSRRIILMTLDGKTAPEIAEALQISVSTVKTLKYRAISQLSSSLSKEDFLTFLFFFSYLLC